MLWGVAACSRTFSGFTDTKATDQPLKPQNYKTYMYEYETFHETYETKSVKLRNPWNHETHEITKPRAYEKFSRNHSLLMKPIITKPAKPMKTTKPLKSQNSWNLMKPRNYDTYENLDVCGRPSGSKSRVNNAKYWTPRNLWNHKTDETMKRRNYNTYSKHIKPNSMNAMKPWILALALYCRSFHFRDFFSWGREVGGGRGQYTGLEWCYNFNRPILIR